MFAKKEPLEKEFEKVEGEAISSIIDGSMTVTGEITFKGKTRIDGVINGNITGEHLILSKDGKIHGDIKVSSFICQGSFVGNIETKILTARRGSSINGKIVAGNLTVEPGASLDGEIKAAASDSAPADKPISTVKPPPPKPENKTTLNK